MNILVTGGAGYIGSVTVDSLIRTGHRVTVLDNFSNGHRSAVHHDAVLEEADLLNFDATREIFARHRPEAVLHFAAHSQVGESMCKPWKYLGENVTAGLNAIRAAAEYGVKRFILSSTANIFGSTGDGPIDETSEIRPGSPYGESKRYLELALGWFEKTHGMRSVCLRYFNAAGATKERGEDRDPETHLIPLVLRVAQGHHKELKIFGRDYDTPDGACIRDYIHVSDLAEAHRLALEVDRSTAYNLGNGHGFSVLEVIEVARRVTGCPIPTIDAPRRPGDPPVLVADSSKIRRELGWTPRVAGIEEIIESAWRWMNRYPAGYRNGTRASCGTSS
jgi:UDP-glucose 4-epimerase